ncbi:FecR family protein [Luteimonas huabeiensis]|uniref:FecR family protein n=1 Tax=Luteimonas huabeiensis TaxID=1244513 RepID=UPI00046591AC|nr:FecR domain-containing protein [Luteimonas huabeiensis]
MNVSGSNEEAKTARLRREADAWVRRLASGEATEDDAHALRRWCAQDPAHRAAFDEARRLWRDLGPATELLRARPGATASGRRLSRRAFLGGLAAASATGAIALALHPPLRAWAPWPDWEADYRTATGEQRRVRLPGRVELAMNTQTRVAVLEAEGGAGGLALLSGEAAIEAPDAPPGRFRVRAGDGDAVAALPARFEVRHLDGRTRVACHAGRVDVRRGERLCTLLAGQRVDYDAAGLQAVTAIDPDLDSAWRDGVVVFRATPLPEAVAEINRYRPGRVVLVGRRLQRQSVSGRFSTADMDTVVAQIQRAFSARVARLPGDVVLLG